MRGIIIFLRWPQPIVTMIAMAAWLLVTVLASIVFWSIALIFGGEAIMDWEGSTLRDEVFFHRACIEGWGAPQHVWRNGETASMRQKSYRPIRRGMSSDYGDAALAIEFADGAILAMDIPFGRATTDFGTPDRFVCADGGRLAFTWQTSRLVAIRGD
jgi:hypothetical protein